MEDEEACKLIAHSIGSVMRHSLDDRFKEECKRFFQARSTKEFEEKFYKKLMETIQTGNRDSSQHQPTGMDPGTSSAVQVQPQNSKHEICTSTTIVTTAAREDVTSTTQITSTAIQRKLSLQEMYCQTIQPRKRSLSPLPALKSKSKLKVRNQQQNSAPF